MTAAHEAPPDAPPSRKRRSGVLRGLASDTVLYGVGGVANQAVAILLVPIYANVLGPEGLGITAVLNTTLSLALMIAGLALPQAFFRWYLNESRDDRERETVLATTLSVRLVGSVGGALVTAGLAVPLVAALYGDLSLLPLFLLLAPIVLFDSLSTIPLSFLRAHRRAGRYALLSFVRAVAGSGLIVVFVVVLGAGVAGVVLGSGIAAAAAAAIGLFVLRRARALRLAWNGPLARSMLAFSLPLVPAAAAGWTLNLSDRYLLQAFTDSAVVGIYALGYTIGLVVNAVVVQPFSLAWGASYWELARAEQARTAFPRVLTAFLAVGCFAALGLSALGTDALRLLAPPAFEPGRLVVPFSAFAYVGYGVYAIGSAGLNIASQTRWQPVVLGVAAALGVVLNLVLIPLLGFMGAALATLASYGLLAVLALIVSNRYYPIRWEVGRGLAVLTVAAALAAAALLGPDHIVWRVATIVAFPPVLVALRIVSVEQLTRLRALVSR